MRNSKLLTTILVAGMLAGCASHKYSVYYKPGSSTLSAADKKVVKEAAMAIKNGSHAKVKVIGYADSVGTKAMNKKLAEKRAKGVDKTLIKMVKKTTNIEVAARGEGFFDWKDKSDADERRVDIKIYK